MIAARSTVMGSRVVDVGFYPVTSDAISGGVASGSDAMLMVANSLLWVAGAL